MNTPAPDAHFFISRLGQALTSIPPEIFSFADRPDFSLPSHSPLGGVFFKRLGISITICPHEFYHGTVNMKSDAPIISNIQIYSGDPYFNHAAYTLPLPHGISFQDDRTSLQRKLGNAVWQFPLFQPFLVERWNFEKYWILAFYNDDMRSIKLLQFGLHPHNSKPSILPKIEQPNIYTVHSLLGDHWKSVAELPYLRDNDFSELEHSKENIEIDALATNGIDLYFRPSKEFNEHFHVFTGIRYVRKGLNSSRGFDGELPYKIQFSDTPEMLLRKIGNDPITGKADTLSGYYVWQLQDYLLHIGFSVMEQRINRIGVNAHGYYSEALVQAPLLRQPA